MMAIPNHLLFPSAGGWWLQEAALVWAWLLWGIQPDAPSNDWVKMIRDDALLTMLDLAKYPPEDDPADEQAIACWVLQSDLAALAAQRGIPYGNPQPPNAAALTPWESAPQTAADQPQALAPAAPVEALEKPRGRPGRPGNPAILGAIAFALREADNGMPLERAAYLAGLQYNVNDATVLREARKKRNNP